jgi:hypothetical protein
MTRASMFTMPHSPRTANEVREKGPSGDPWAVRPIPISIPEHSLIVAVNQGCWATCHPIAAPSASPHVTRVAQRAPEKGNAPASRRGRAGFIELSVDFA